MTNFIAIIIYTYFVCEIRFVGTNTANIFLAEFVSHKITKTIKRQILLNDFENQTGIYVPMEELDFDKK